MDARDRVGGDHPGVGEERGRNAREHVAREYSWDTISDVVSQAYEDALGVG